MSVSNPKPKKVVNAVGKSLYGDNIPPEVDIDNIEKVMMEKSWDDIESLFLSISDVIVNVSTSFLELIRLTSSDELKDHITREEHIECSILSNGFSRDSQNLTTDIVNLHKKHAGKTGPLTENDMFMCFDIFERYVAIEDQLSALLIPIISRVTEIVGTAAEKRQAALSNLSADTVH